MLKDFKVYSSLAAYGAGFSGFLYALSFVVLQDQLLSAIFLMLGGLFALAVFVALYNQLKEVDSQFAQFIVLLGFIGSAGALLHGGYDLANVINPPSSVNLDLPSQVDPRGLLAFGITGVAILKVSWLMGKNKIFPGSLNYLGVLSGLLLIVIYLARLTVLSPASPILRYPVLLEGFIVNPIWYIWLGSVLGKKR